MNGATYDVLARLSRLEQLLDAGAGAVTCRHCGLSFNPKRAGTLYCSAKCRDRWHYHHSPASKRHRDRRDREDRCEPGD